MAAGLLRGTVAQCRSLASRLEGGSRKGITTNGVGTDMVDGPGAGGANAVSSTGWCIRDPISAEKLLLRRERERKRKHSEDVPCLSGEDHSLAVPAAVGEQARPLCGRQIISS